MALRIGPFVLLRRRVDDGAFASRVRAAEEAIVPVRDLLGRRGVRLGQVPAGGASAVELAAVRAQLEALPPLRRAVDDARPRGCLEPLRRALPVALDRYAETLETYAAVCQALRDADATAYRRHNARGRDLDARAVEAAVALVAAHETALPAVELPETLRRLAREGQAYRRLIGGAIAFWEEAG